MVLVPTESAIVASLEKDGMEHRESKSNLFEVSRRFLVTVEELGVGKLSCLVATKHV